MIKILIALFNSLFFFGLIFVFVQNWVIAGVVAGAVCLITFFAMCLATMSHNSDNVLAIRDLHQKAYQDGPQFVSQGARAIKTTPILIQKKNLTQLPERKEPVYSKSN